MPGATATSTYSAARCARADCLPDPEPAPTSKLLQKRALDDLVVVRKATTDPEISDAIAGFHAQQAVEKLLKAVLAARGAHDLQELIVLAEAAGLELPAVDRHAVVELVAFAVEQRYGGYDDEPLDRAATLVLAQEVAAWAARELG
jgi:HEPN domain-containing protein